jgi:predicted nuclease of predicted toxin-antitoxin system
MRFLIDAQLPPAMARWLASIGHDANHVQDCGLAHEGDSVIWTYALKTGAVIVTKDEDFARRRMVVASGPSIVWLRWPNTRKPQLLMWFSAALPRVTEALERQECLVELSPPRRSVGRL